VGVVGRSELCELGEECKDLLLGEVEVECKVLMLLRDGDIGCAFASMSECECNGTGGCEMLLKCVFMKPCGTGNGGICSPVNSTSPARRGGSGNRNDTSSANVSRKLSLSNPGR
jgi:hypothetical protein